MNNFQLIASNVDVVPLLLSLNAQKGLWNQNDLRTTYPDSPHSNVDDIWLRFNDFELGEELVVADDIECRNYPAFALLPQARELVMTLMARVQGERLGRVLITKLPAGGKIPAHPDQGAPATYYERYHIALQGLAGSLFRCGDEQVCMRTGQIWWLDNSVEHEVINNSADDRIHMIIDIKRLP